ncbi:MFS transporter [Streptococcus gallinaceus]|uniref:Fucose permease n=1 Tax=Streptococcus gallinaceus TaxID=165758 RepID=A0ABV2JKW3_9STRE
MFQVLLLMIYLAFVSLGLPDGLLGASWPSMRAQMDLPMSYMGIISTIISIGTIVSSLQSDRLTKNLGAGKVTALSVALTAFALFGFGISLSFVWLCVFAIPYGLGAGSVDAALNNYVALHYSSKHMSWLHCMWGLGASVGPYVVSFTLGQGQVWNNAYFYVGMIQVALTIGLFASLTLIGLLLVGLGCAPIYPCIIHSTPHHFGKDRSQAVIGVQMASAYVGTTVLPPLFGLLGQQLNLGLFPFYTFRYSHRNGSNARAIGSHSSLMQNIALAMFFW